MYKDIPRIEEMIISYTYNLNYSYMNHPKLIEKIKKDNTEQRMSFVINECLKSKIETKQLFLLALSYSALNSKYNNLAIYYCEQYLKILNKFICYDIEIKGCETHNDKVNYQLKLFNYLIACKYLENLEYKLALEHAIKAKGMYGEQFEIRNPYLLISEILYKMNKYDKELININEGIKNTKNKYWKQKMIDYKDYLIEKKKKKYIYKAKNIKRPRYEPETGFLYDLNTGEILS